MTLNELYAQVKDKKKGTFPKLEDLINSKYRLIAEGKHNTGIVKVYDTGYILYFEDDRYTVFHISDVYGRGEQYATEHEYAVPYDSRRIKAEFFNNQDWLLRIVMEGNDRITHNHENNERRYVAFRYSDIGEDIKQMGYIPEYLTDDEEPSAEELIDKVREKVDPDLWAVYVSIKIYGKKENALAAELKISQQAVSKRYRKACKTIPEVRDQVDPRKM